MEKAVQRKLPGARGQYSPINYSEAQCINEATVLLLPTRAPGPEAQSADRASPEESQGPQRV